MPKTLLTPAILSSYRPKKDGSMTLTFATQEMTQEQKVDAITHYQQFGWLGFVDSEDATDLEIPDQDPVREGKTPQQRLRGIMYVYWKEREITEPFNGWYERQIEIYINDIKEKLDE